MVFPIPNPLNKGVSAQRFTAGAFGFELSLNDHLCGNASVVCAHLPQRVVAAHAVVANEGIHDRLLKAVPHVERARDVGGWYRDAVSRSIAAGRKVTLRLPAGIPAGLDIGGREVFIHGHRRGLISAAVILKVVFGKRVATIPKESPSFP